MYAITLSSLNYLLHRSKYNRPFIILLCRIGTDGMKMQVRHCGCLHSVSFECNSVILNREPMDHNYGIAPLLHRPF